MTKMPLISWSGGVDSTAVVIWYFSKKIPFSTVYLKIPNNKINQKKELDARKKILKKLTSIYGSYHVEDHVLEYVCSVTNNSFLPSQAYIWATTISYYIDLSEYSKLSFGYIKKDDFWHFRHEFEQLITYAQRMANRDFIGKFEYILEYLPKDEVIKDYYKFDDNVKGILKLVHYCEGNSDEDCECKKCIEFNESK